MSLLSEELVRTMSGAPGAAAEAVAFVGVRDSVGAVLTPASGAEAQAVTAAIKAALGPWDLSIISPNDGADLTVAASAGIYCTSAGNVKVTTVNGSTLTYTVPTGGGRVPFPIAKVFATGTTVTSTNIYRLIP